MYKQQELQSIQSSEYKEKFDKDQVPFESETAFRWLWQELKRYDVLL